MKIQFLLPVILVLNFSCSTTNNMSATVDIRDVKFLVNPYVLNKNGDFFLVYQVDVDEQKSNVRLQIGEKRTKDKFYYFFIGKSSFAEYDHIVFRPVNKNGDISILFKSGSVFWLNPDATEIKLKIVNQ